MSIIGLFVAKQKMEKAKESLKEEVDALKKEVAELRKKNGLDEYIHKAKTENVLIVRVRSYSLGTIASVLLNKDIEKIDDDDGYYQVVSKDGEELFMSDLKSTFLTDRDILTVYDMSEGKRKIGTVKQWLVSGRIPLLEKEAKTCTVMLEKNKLCDLKRYISFGELQFDTYDGDAWIRVKAEDHYAIKYKGREIAQLHELSTKMKDGFSDRYVIEYKDKKDQKIVAMMAIALDICNT